MTKISEFLNPETLFSRENPFLKSAEATHRLVFETLDKTARLQLSFAEDLLEINRERFVSIYASESVSDFIAAQQNLVAQLGKRAARYAGDLKEVVSDVQAGATEAANEYAAAPAPKKPAPKSKKAA
jgi:hypothetical protein